MRGKATPIEMLQSQAAAMIDTMPRLRDGDIEAIHDARVASRRIREVLPLTGEWYPQDAIDNLAGTFREVGKTLGRARDADARIALLKYFDARVPPAAASLVALERQEDDERLRLVRKLIKKFESLDVQRLLDNLAAGPRRGRRSWTNIGARWPDQLRRLTVERAAATLEAVHYATGVYFPNRGHAARIALKKFRYALEIVSAVT